MSLKQNFPSIRPSLLLDFANAKVLDPRVTFTRTSTATYFDSEGVLRTAASGESRFTFDPVTEESLGLLIEEARTNLLTYSEQFDNAAWSKFSSSVSADAITSPDGAITADKLIESATTAAHYLKGTHALSASTFTVSFFAKAGERSVVMVFLASVAGSVVWFNLATGAVGTNQGAATATSISNIGNGWYRCTATFSSTVANDVCVGVSSGNNTFSYTGDGTSGLYIWGAQLEAGTFPTSYIPTVAAQVTRAADSASMTGVNFSSWFNNAEGTLYAEGSAQQFGLPLARISDGTATNRIEIRSVSDGRSEFFVNSNNVIQADIYGAPAASLNISYKNALGYKANDFVGYSSTGFSGIDASGSVPVVSQIQYIGFNSTIKKLAYYPVRLSNTQLQALTA